jgi:hypothetical protein
MDFPHAGDLMVISTVYPDGTVAALEELIGNHGGLGGEQTDAFIFHPPDMEVPETRNATDVFHILNNHRGAPVVERPVVEEPEQIADWAPANLAKGIGELGTWLGRALRCVVLDRSAFQEVVKDPLMTGPALLIALVALVLTAMARADSFSPLAVLATVVAWPLSVVAVFGAGYLLTRQGTFTKTFRAMGFAHSVFVVEVLAFIRPVAPIVHLLVIVVGFFAVWIGGATAHNTRGWRTIVLPLLANLLTVVAVAAFLVLLAGTGYSIAAVLRSLGLEAAP